jgi:hypothetical protein
VNLAANITDVSPANGGTLNLTDATWLDRIGVIKIDTEEIHYFGRDATSVHTITRGYNSTTPAAHTTAALVYQQDDWRHIAQALPAFISADDPPTGGDLYLFDTTDLDPAGGLLRLHSEEIEYTSLTATHAVDVTRGANGTTAAGHPPHTPIWVRDDTLGPNRLPIVGSIEWRRWLRTTAAGMVITPEIFQIFGSVTESPLYPGDSDWQFDWLDGTPLVEVTGNQSPTWEPSNWYPRRLRHILMRCQKMTDDGRFKLNTLRAYRRQLDGAPNDETGAGVIVRDGLERVLPENAIAIEVGAFDGTTGDVTTAEASVSEVLNDLLTENFAVCRCERDGTVTVFRDPFHPLGQRVEVDAAFTADMFRSPMTTTYPSRLGADQIVVELYNARTGDVFEGRYPPQANALNVRRVTLRRAAASQESANNAAARIYLAQPEISRAFTFTTSGAAEWMTVGMRLLITDFSDEQRPEGVMVNSIVRSVTHEEAEEVSVQEWRAL